MRFMVKIVISVFAGLLFGVAVGGVAWFLLEASSHRPHIPTSIEKVITT